MRAINFNYFLAILAWSYSDYQFSLTHGDGIKEAPAVWRWGGIRLPSEPLGQLPVLQGRAEHLPRQLDYLITPYRGHSITKRTVALVMYKLLWLYSTLYTCIFFHVTTIDQVHLQKSWLIHVHYVWHPAFCNGQVQIWPTYLFQSKLESYTKYTNWHAISLQHGKPNTSRMTECWDTDSWADVWFTVFWCQKQKISKEPNDFPMPLNRRHNVSFDLSPDVAHPFCLEELSKQLC